MEKIRRRGIEGRTSGGYYPKKKHTPENKKKRIFKKNKTGRSC